MKQFVKRLLNSLGYELRGIRMTPRQLLQPQLLRALEFDDVICRRMFEVGDAFTFVQVGAFDGVVQDPLRKYIAAHRWRGVMIEPQPRPAEKLRDMYRDNDGVLVLQAAIDATPGTRALYTVDSPAAPAWAGALASFHKDVLLRQADLIPGLDGMIKELAVDCISFDDVLDRLPASPLDLLQIDTEGADGDILSLFPFQRIKPAIVHWEISHLSHRQREDCLGLLAGHGYRFAPSGSQDMLAVQL